MSIEIVTVKSRRELKKFIHLPAEIHIHHSNWVPPIYMDEWAFFNPEKNKAYSYSDTIQFLAYKEGKPAGRIMGIINHKYNEASAERDGRFSFLETYEDYELAKVLLKAVEDWAREKGMKNLVGPLGFSDKDPQGFLIEGFNEPVVISSNANYPYLVDFVEKAGYGKKIDLVVYKLQIPREIPDFYRKIYDRTMKNDHRLRLVELKSKSQIKAYVKPVFRLMNETFRDIYAFAPLSEKEMIEFYRRYYLILDHRFLKIIENDKKEVVAFILGIPDLSEGIRKCKGYVLPFGFISILRSQKRTRQLDLLLGAIREDYRNQGLNTILGIMMLEEAHRAGFEYLDSHLELENNYKMRAEMEKMGGVVYKRFRIFTKPLQ